MKSALLSEKSPTEQQSVSLYSWPFICLIYIYRYTLSPVIGNNCRFYPSCSHYSEEALRRHGAWQGSIMTIRRVFRCHPFHPGGYDPVE